MCGVLCPPRSEHSDELRRSFAQLALHVSCMHVALCELRMLALPWLQVTDTPGLLSRPDEFRNAMEKLTLAALEHLPTRVLFVADLTEECGTSLQVRTRVGLGAAWLLACLMSCQCGTCACAFELKSVLSADAPGCPACCHCSLRRSSGRFETSSSGVSRTSPGWMCCPRQTCWRRSWRQLTSRLRQAAARQRAGGRSQMPWTLQLRCQTQCVHPPSLSMAFRSCNRQ